MAVFAATQEPPGDWRPACTPSVCVPLKKQRPQLCARRLDGHRVGGGLAWVASQMVSMTMKRCDSSAGPYFFSIVFSSSLPMASVSPCGRRRGAENGQRRQRVPQPQPRLPKPRASRPAAWQRLAAVSAGRPRTPLKARPHLQHCGLVGHADAIQVRLGVKALTHRVLEL